MTDPLAPDPRRWRMLMLLCGAALVGMSPWFAGTAVVPELRARWDLSVAQAGWLTSLVQLGFVAGTAAAALLNLADILPARGYFAACAVGAALSNAALLIAPSYATALAARFLTGFFLAGVYPPAMKMVATWFRTARGFAIGSLIGALTLGKAMPYLIHALGERSLEQVVLVTSMLVTLAGALVGAFYRDGPHAFPRRPFSWQLAVTVVRHRETRLAIASYLGHMWELYAMWIWLPAFLLASAAARSAAGYRAPGEATVDLLAFGAIASGALGCLWAGWAAGRVGYARVVTWAMTASGLCCLLVGSLFGASFWVLVPLAWVWGFFVVADSAQFSALVTEVAPAHSVGTALTLQTSMGFLLTMATIQLVPVMVEAFGWRWAFPLLALGPMCGIAAIARLPGSPRAPAP